MSDKHPKEMRYLEGLIYFLCLAAARHRKNRSRHAYVSKRLTGWIEKRNGS